MNSRTLAIIKPDAVATGHTGAIIDLIELSGFTIAAMEKVYLSAAQAQEFYAMHAHRSFFNELVEFMTSGPVVVMALDRMDAVQTWRDLMGATNPREARVGTVRALYAQDIGKNAVHGSDSPESALREVAFFFPKVSA